MLAVAMRIAFLTSADARQPLAWAGTPYFMARALSRVASVSYVGPVLSYVEFAGRVRNRVSRALLGRGYVNDHTAWLARDYARLFRKRIPSDTDLVVAPAGSTQIAFLETDVPILYTSDATFALMRDYYPRYSALPPSYLREADDIERRALERARFLFFPSEWAARSAREQYGVAADKIHIAPYGANLHQVPAREEVLAAKRDIALNLLFLGVDWERKGGPLAVEATSLLRGWGFPAKLVVCGCVPPARHRADWIDVIPRLDKRKPAEERRLSRLLLDSAFLFLPSRFECYGIVYCEASAHGTPSIAADTGGVPGVVRDGENGFLIPHAAGAEAFARRIAESYADRGHYRCLVASTRAAYEDRLNWERWAQRAGDAVRGRLTS